MQQTWIDPKYQTDEGKQNKKANNKDDEVLNTRQMKQSEIKKLCNKDKIFNTI